MGSIALIYGLFGALGYAIFGEETKDIITTNLSVEVLIVAVQIGLCIFFTFPVMMNLVFEVPEPWVSGKRCLVVLAVSLVATLMPNFVDFLSLVGCSVCIELGFMLPTAFHLKAFSSDLSWIEVASDISIVAIGMGLIIFDRWSSFVSIFNSSEA